MCVRERERERERERGVRDIYILEVKNRHMFYVFERERERDSNKDLE